MTLQEDSQPEEKRLVPAKGDALSPVLAEFEDHLAIYLNIAGHAASRVSFWTAVPLLTLLAAVYFCFIADPLYVSESTVSIRHSASIGGSVSSMLGSLTGSGGSSDENASLATFIVSNDMLNLLDKQFHLRKIYSEEPRNPFHRLSRNASQEQFLAFYRSEIELDVRYDVGLLTIRVLDYKPKRAQEINLAILSHAETFMNSQSLAMMESSLTFARNELAEAQLAAKNTPPDEQDVARMRLQSAQQAYAGAANVAGQQQTFLARVTSPNLPSQPTRPERLIDILAAAIIASILYVVLSLAFANVRDHRAV